MFAFFILYLRQSLQLNWKLLIIRYSKLCCAIRQILLISSSKALWNMKESFNQFSCQLNLSGTLNFFFHCQAIWSILVKIFKSYGVFFSIVKSEMVTWNASRKAFNLRVQVSKKLPTREPNVAKVMKKLLNKSICLFKKTQCQLFLAFSLAISIIYVLRGMSFFLNVCVSWDRPSIRTLSITRTLGLWLMRSPILSVEKCASKSAQLRQFQASFFIKQSCKPLEKKGTEKTCKNSNFAEKIIG